MPHKNMKTQGLAFLFSASSTARELIGRVRKRYVSLKRVVEQARCKNRAWDDNQGMDWDSVVGTGKYTRSGAWPKILHFAMERDIDVEELIRCAFIDRWGKVPIEPDKMLASNALDWYHRVAEVGPKALKRRLRAELTRFAMERQVGMSAPLDIVRPLPVAHVLLEPTVELRPLIRYVLAVHGDEQSRALLDRFEKDAVWDYLRSPKVWEAVLGGWIPDGLRQRALALRTRIVGKPATDTEFVGGGAIATPTIEQLLRDFGALPHKPLTLCGWRAAGVESPPWPCGVPFVDRLLGDGVRPSGVYGILGAIGSGKTLLATQLAWAAALRELLLQSLYPGYVPRRVFYFSLEMSRDCMVRWLLSVAGQLHEGVLEKTIELVDWCTENAGTDLGIPGISGYLDQRCQQSGTRPAVVIIDNAGLCVRRQLSRQGYSLSLEASLLNSFAVECRGLIATPLRCEVWVTHHLIPGIEASGLGASLDEGMAAVGRRFALGTDACLALSSLDRTSGCVRLACVRGTESGRELLLELDGHYGGLREFIPRY